MKNQKNKSEIDISVLLIFFVRANTFEKVFESVRKARPSHLLLWQDGPRQNREDDIIGIEKCRKIIDEGLDWECEVDKVYNEKNYGCDPSTFYAQRWAFTKVDKCIILEDDQVPSQSFYKYCKELLDKYENDERINHICGHNFYDDKYQCPDDYLFAYHGTGAWASWKRVAETWDENYSFLNNDFILKNLKNKYKKRYYCVVNNAYRHKMSSKAHWESILGMSSLLNSRYAIIPRINLVQNIGFCENATHSILTDINVLPKECQIIYKEAKEINFPLKHPEYIILDYAYDKLNLNLLFNTSIFKSLMIKIKIIINMICKGNLYNLIKIIKNKIK